MRSNDDFSIQGNHSYRTFVAEYPTASSFRQMVKHKDTYLKYRDFRFAKVDILRGGQWEYDFSADSAQSHISAPAPHLIQHLALHWDRQTGWLESEGALAAFSLEQEHRHGLYVRRDLLDRYLTNTCPACCVSKYAQTRKDGSCTVGRLVISPL
ncbi:hypothetical protein EOS_16490 [Caballeronia mineralivorans PML1(12)]|uniref:Uncharacterized protein n=1 Tax=Caballeronia mineralivorans PML1(12) TaxID=908627 RepID=A0A0J1FYV8_9BURK|nr:hypothetical protein EOS_16490 [Caballeronia mineralivorans PML1(12)]